MRFAQPAWNDDWKHAEDRTEPPEERENERTCGTCYHFDRCPSDRYDRCEWGVCLARSDANYACWVRELDTDSERECKDWEEA